MEYNFEILKARIYINSQKKSLADIQKETGCDVCINGGLYNMKTFKPLCHLKAAGKVLASDQYKYWGYGWNASDGVLSMVNSYETLDNFICCTALVKDGKATSLFYDPAQGGKRGRSAVGTLPNGKTVIFCSKDGTADAMTPEALQQYCMKQGWKDAIMLDSGGSSQCITPDGKITSTRKVHNVLCFWLKTNKTQDVNDTMGKKKIGTAGLNLIKSFEGCRLTAYKAVPTEKYWTIGWGHYGSDVKRGDKITQAEADALLVKDVASSVAAVNNPAYCPITASLNQNQFDALVSFTFNCRAASLKTLCKGRTAAQIADKLTAYNKSGGKVLAGLVRRREAEQKLFNTPVETATAEPDTVKDVQTWLNRNFSSGLTPDGLYGTQTKRALVKALQKTLGVVADGIYGAKTEAAVKTLKKGSSGKQVEVLQGFLICRKQKLTLNGSYDDQTELAVRTIQGYHRITADGIAGKMTFRALCK